MHSAWVQLEPVWGPFGSVWGLLFWCPFQSVWGVFAGSDLGLFFWSPVGVQLESSWDLLESALSPLGVLLNLFWVCLQGLFGVCCFEIQLGLIWSQFWIHWNLL